MRPARMLIVNADEFGISRGVNLGIIEAHVHVIVTSTSAMRQQLADFREHFGRDPDHLDSHQHAHPQEPLRSILTNIARELNVPLRHFSRVQYCGDFYGQNETGQSFPQLIRLDALLQILSELPIGMSELCCHPASSHDLRTMYGTERVQELQTLCDPRAREFLHSNDIALCSFANVAR